MVSHTANKLQVNHIETITIKIYKPFHPSPFLFDLSTKAAQHNSDIISARSNNIQHALDVLAPDIQLAYWRTSNSYVTTTPSSPGPNNSSLEDATFTCHP